MICSNETLRRKFIEKVVLFLKKKNVEDPDDIFIIFSGDYVVSGTGKNSSLCIIGVSPAASTKDLVKLINILKHECALGDNNIRIFNLASLPEL